MLTMDCGYGSNWLIQASPATLRAVLTEFETQFGLPTPLPHPKKPRADIVTLSRPGFDVAVGDMFAIAQTCVGRVGVVNAANNIGLGCFAPDHKCVDNQIHRLAGPRLRLFMASVPQDAHGNRVPDGTCVASPAYRLDATAILHTTAPNCSGRTVTEEDWRTLMCCYDSCIEYARSPMNPASREAARGLSLDVVVFPTLGTGLYGFPKREAALRLQAHFSSRRAEDTPRVMLVVRDTDDVAAFLHA